MERQITVARTSPGSEEVITHMEALVIARAGRLDAAAKMSRGAVDISEEAPAEFQKILDHRGFGSAIRLAHPRLEMGRANALAGDSAKAIAA